MAENYLQKLRKVKAFFFDVDGVLSDGSVTLMPNGDQVRVMNVKDGYVLQLAVKLGYHVCIITGGKSDQVKNRMQGLGVEHVYMGISNKLECFNEHCKIYNIDPNESLYMGDDIPDYEVMKEIGFASCPLDASAEIKELCNYISDIKGGEGCVRDVMEKTIKVQGKWFTQNDSVEMNKFFW
jgi:3-deoxy-D-manno-octulosonate 8-phosphate phosphatase (KDO 8-P phosphatase)|tara:strand:- start:484 stop:1026 length:543 start_codon:yes stop_codon:yes gene_type:complete